MNMHEQKSSVSTSTTGAAKSGEAKSTNGNLKEKMGQVADQAMHTKDDMMDKAQAAKGAVIEQVKETSMQVKERATQQAKSLMTAQKERMAGELDSVAQAFRQTSQSLKESNHEAIAQYTDSLAAQVERFSGYIRDKNMDQVVAQVESFARQRPGLFWGTALSLGFMLARFLKSSSPSRYGRSGRYGYGYGGGQDYGMEQDFDSPLPARSTSGYRTPYDDTRASGMSRGFDGESKLAYGQAHSSGATDKLPYGHSAQAETSSEKR